MLACGYDGRSIAKASLFSIRRAGPALLAFGSRRSLALTVIKSAILGPRFGHRWVARRLGNAKPRPVQARLMRQKKIRFFLVFF